MKRWGLMLVLVCLLGGSSLAADKPLLTVYTYDSFASWGPAGRIEELFEATHDVDVQFVALGDSRAMLTRLQRERQAGKQGADVFLGIEASDLARRGIEGLFLPLSSDEISHLATVSQDLLLDETLSLVPYEHGYITLVYDSHEIETDGLARTFDELLDPTYVRSLILEDPRTSSPGLSFLLWTIIQFGDPGYLDFWRALMPNVLTIAGGWGEAYDLYLAGEAPMVVSFSTDTAYSVIAGGDAHHRVMLLENQGYRNVYFMGIVEGTEHRELAAGFIDLVLSAEIQELIPTTEWMFPANREALLPVQFYQHAVTPPDAAMMDPSEVAENLDRWLREWSAVVIGG